MPQLICLANSRKPGGRCIAGKRLHLEEVGTWMRPVSARNGEEVSAQERQYQDGTEPQLLDVIDIPVLPHEPEAPQTENCLLDRGRRWRRVGSFPANRLDELVDRPFEPLWVNGFSTAQGANDRIPVEEIGDTSSSLRLIDVDVVIDVVMLWDRRRVQASFTFLGDDYAFWVTDPHHENRFLRGENGRYPLGRCYLTVSLGEPFKGAYSKLVAAIMERGE